MAYETFGKSGKTGKPSGFRKYKQGIVVKTVTPSMYEMQGSFAKNQDAERVDQYAKPGTSAAARAKDPYSYSFPTSRYRSRMP